MYPFLPLITSIFALLLLPRAMSLAAPFIVGFLLYLLCRRPVRRLSSIGLGRSAAAFLALSFISTLILGAAAALAALAYNERGRLPAIYARISAIQPDNSLLKGFISTFRDELTEMLRTILLQLASYLQNITGFVMVMVFALLAAFFFLRDEERLMALAGKWGLASGAREFKQTAFTALGGYIRAQLWLMLLTFALLSVFLVLFGVKYALLIALVVALVDAIPVFGTGCVLLPWAAYEFLTGYNALGFGLLALYGVCSLTRQILEPRILSSRIGLHPLLTLAGIFVGFKLLGFWGLILGPIIVLVIVTYIQKRE